MTLREVLIEATHRLERQRIPNPRLCAEALLAHCLGVERTFLYTHDDRSISPGEYATLENALYDRINGVPVQYIAGRQEFYGRNFIVNPSVLIPRPETEYIVESLLERRPEPGSRIIDVGTGSGCIAVTLALEVQEPVVYASDISERALVVAKRNAAELGADVSFVCMDLLDAVAATFDFVVSNPPYVRRSDLDQLQREVRDHEPHTALFPDGGVAAIYRRLVDAAFHVLKPGGWLIMEIGFGMEEEILQLLIDSWDPLPTKLDLQGIPRTIVARKKGIGLGTTPRF